MALAQVEPDPLDRVQLRAVGGLDQQGDVDRDLEGMALVPAGTVEDQDEVNVGRPPGGEVVEEDLHRLGIGHRQDQCAVLAGGRADGGEDMRPAVAELLPARRPFAPPPPAVAEPTLVADPGLVFEPEFDLPVRIIGRG
jgi:hypothetical protein